MNKLVVINACVRQADSRTLRIAEPLIAALGERYEITRYDLPEMEGVVPLTPALFAGRGRGEIPAWALAKISACIARGLELAENW